MARHASPQTDGRNPRSFRAVLELKNVSRSFSQGNTTVHALKQVDLCIYPGEFVAIMGPSGSGKSTLLSLAGGLDTPSSGEVWICGQNVTGLSRDELSQIRRRQLGFVFQDFNLIPVMTAAENIALPLELDGSKAKAAREAALFALDCVGLTDLQDRFITDMSGGQRQRIAIARAIAGDRRLVLADEPTGALDSHTGDEILAILRQLADEGISIVLVTHEARHAAWADRVVFLKDGSIIDQSQVQNNPNSLLPSDTGLNGRY